MSSDAKDCSRFVCFSSHVFCRSLLGCCLCFVSRVRYKPSLKAGQLAMREIERKQWLARKWQADISHRHDQVKEAQIQARKK